jgi:hypothetical protein
MSIYVTQENQKLLWNTLHKSPLVVEVFSQNQIQQKEQWFKSVIEMFFNQYRFKTLSKRDLQQLNQDTLTNMMQQLREYISKNQPIQKDISSSQSTPPIPQNNRQDFFTTFRMDNAQCNVDFSLNSAHETGRLNEKSCNNQFQQRQREYEQMAEKPVTDTIDFRDKMDDEPISNMDELIRTHMQMRENELKQYAPPPPIPPSTEEVHIKEVEPTKPKISTMFSNKDEKLQEQIDGLIKKTQEMQEQIDRLKSKPNVVDKSINTEETT